eukprot:SAG11_NODE_13307_length_661_cov_0.718861_1_plen_170_part_10
MRQGSTSPAAVELERTARSLLHLLSALHISCSSPLDAQRTKALVPLVENAGAAQHEAASAIRRELGAQRAKCVALREALQRCEEHCNAAVAAQLDTARRHVEVLQQLQQMVHHEPPEPPHLPLSGPLFPRPPSAYGTVAAAAAAQHAALRHHHERAEEAEYRPGGDGEYE